MAAFFSVKRRPGSAPDPDHRSFLDNFSFGGLGHSAVEASGDNVHMRGLGADVARVDSEMDSELPDMLPQAGEDGSTSYTGSYYHYSGLNQHADLTPPKVSRITITGI